MTGFAGIGDLPSLDVSALDPAEVSRQIGNLTPAARAQLLHDVDAETQKADTYAKAVQIALKVLRRVLETGASLA